MHEACSTTQHGARSTGPAASAGSGRSRFRPRGFGILLLLLVVLSCTSSVSFNATAKPGLDELGANELAAEQRRSLGYLFYRGNAMPPTPTQAELQALEHDLRTGPEVEIEELFRLFGNDEDLLVYATRDSDGDGILDYRISEYRGKFFEGDLDLDGDGVRNVYDSHPYDPERGGVDTIGDGVPDRPGSFADRDGDGIPDHLDWSRRKAAPLPELQTELFRDFDLILVERSARFTPELVQAADDTMRVVFGERLSTLRTLAVEDQLLIAPDLGDNGLMLAQTQTLTVYTDSLTSASPLVLLGLLVHEVDHAWQLAQDFDEGDLDAENKKMHFPPGNFTMGLESFGWEVEAATMGGGYTHEMYWPHFFATSPRYRFRGSTPAEWAQWFERERRESGPNYLRESPAAQLGVVGPYSLTSPWEWHADHLLAAVYNQLDRGMSNHDNETIVALSEVLTDQMLQSVQHQWSRFDYRNAAGTGIDRQLTRRFKISEAELDPMIERYVLPLAELPMITDVLARSLTRLDEVETLSQLSEGWVDIRERFESPIALTPDFHRIARLTNALWQPRGVGHTPSEGTEPLEPIIDDRAGAAQVGGSPPRAGVAPVVSLLAGLGDVHASESKSKSESELELVEPELDPEVEAERELDPDLEPEPEIELASARLDTALHL